MSDFISSPTTRRALWRILAALLAVAAVAVATLPNISIEVARDQVSYRAETVVLNDTDEGVAILGIWRLGGPWRSVRPRNIAWTWVVRLSPGELRHLTFEREGADSVALIARGGGDVRLIVIFPHVADTQAVSSAGALSRGHGSLPYDVRFLIMPIALASASLWISRGRARRAASDRPRIADMLALGVIAYCAFVLLDVLRFSLP